VSGALTSTRGPTPDGELFGLDRLAGLLEHQAGGLRGDATLLLVQWTSR